MPNKQIIRNEQFMEQLKDFSGLSFGAISPTDIDGFLDFGNKVFIFFELKYKHPHLPRGQELALERLCDACQSSDREAYLIVAIHNAQATERIDVARAEVNKMRWRGKWYPRKDEHETLRELIMKILAHAHGA